MGFGSTIVAKIERKKRNFSAPRPDRVVNFWWKRATSLHDEVTQAFMAISNLAGEYPQCFAKGKTSHHKVNSEISIQDNRHLHKRER